ncbi:DUF4244 domain-containing protein [Krasilnikoviella flava]|uniref:DUF4244 domain-containing protein n=1 Tax=Krasilnikoviella flava TaxID=526729 RepID=A0A1T5LIG2_9MICO|nr:DUF4244 domain-containing protein [Krasilnikoviella flava]SKC75158.1 Protein of unknown function [Krasilnikoviella flava]
MRNEDEGRSAAEVEQGGGASTTATEGEGSPGVRSDEPARAPRTQGVDPEAGLATAEYAVATVAAVGFAGLLIAVLKSDTVRGLLEGIISSALSV